MFDFNPAQLFLFLVILLLLFGSSRLPSLMRNLGRSATEFKKGMRGEFEEEPESKETPKTE
ncbi:MAG: twin-arginine translocase TatA/TatE family subunit [Pirellulales bacterium]